MSEVPGLNSARSVPAKAQGEMARQLLELAQQEGIIIHQDALLTD